VANLRLRVVPRSSKSSLSISQGKLKAHLQSPPLGGRANEELVRLIASLFGLRRADVTVIRGLKSREKVVDLTTVSDEELQDLLRNL